jgi:hypothetical protein
MQYNSNPRRDDRRFETSMEVCSEKDGALAVWSRTLHCEAIFGRLQGRPLIGPAFPLTVSRIACRTKTRLAQNVLQNKATPQALVRFPRCFLIRHGKRQRALWNLCLQEKISVGVRNYELPFRTF